VFGGDAAKHNNICPQSGEAASIAVSKGDCNVQSAALETDTRSPWRGAAATYAAAKGDVAVALISINCRIVVVMPYMV
jgi:hypothetical protein